MGLDIGEEGKKIFREHILGCKTILWNGPVGVFEMDKFATGSKAVAEAIAEATSKGAFSLIGGGDSVACINKFGLADKVSYVSTGGGALLEYIEGKEAAGCGGHPQISRARTERGPIEPLSVLNRKQTETLKYLE